MSRSIEFTQLPTSDPLDIDLERGESFPTSAYSTKTNNDTASSATPSTSAAASSSPSHGTSTGLPRKPKTLSGRIEQLTDKAIDGLGPVLLTLAFVLLSTCIFCYFTVVFPYHHQWKEGEGIFGNFGYVLSMIWSCYLVWGIAANYYYAVRTPPGGVLDGITRTTDDGLYRDVLQEMETYTEITPTCKRCHLPKPERTHHCSVCKTCVLKYDHHCPWIHNCVGHFNHRFFLMFLTYLSTACFYYAIMGAGPFMLAAEVENGTLTAQTTLEQYNNNYIKKMCKKRGEKFTNMYDFGVVGNFLDFFNIGPRGPWYTALLPLPIPPIGNGKRFEKSGRGFVLDFGDEDEDMV
ncbi:hypothetical protein BGZ94_000756 [Podila epigama]|nr:hypothetical protein BGZ94_000756 [Podila epigama]